MPAPLSPTDPADGTTVEANQLPLVEWLRHAYHETLDKAIYLRRAIEEIEKTQ